MAARITMRILISVIDGDLFPKRLGYKGKSYLIMSPYIISYDCIGLDSIYNASLFRRVHKVSQLHMVYVYMGLSLGARPLAQQRRW